MSIKLTKRAAAQIMKRGVNSVRIQDGALEDAKKAITKEDVRALIKSGKVYAIKERTTLSLHGKELREKRHAGRARGPGRRKGAYKARRGSPYVKKVRAQRRILASLKGSGEMDNATFKRYYALVKGGTFQTKLSLINHIRTGVKMSDERAAELKRL